MESSSTEKIEKHKKMPSRRVTRKKYVKNVRSKKKEKKKTVFSCDICNKQFAAKDLLKAHEKIHSSRTFSCEQCEFTSHVAEYVTRHVKRMHGGERGHVCGVCGNQYQWQSKLKHHMLVHTGEKPHKCDVCGKAFNTTYSLNTHKFIHTNEKPFKCSHCEYACRDSSTLRKHQARHTGQQKLYKCKICSKTVKNKWKLKNHIAEEHLQLDIRKHLCAACGRGFKLKSNLSIHIRVVHEKSTRVTCEICDVQISTKNNLRAHMLTHIDARPYKCTFDGCGKTYKEITTLRRHTIVHYPEQHHRCEICNKTFSRETRLQRHLLQHLPRAKSLECHHCGARFFNKSYLSKHIRRKHTGRRTKYVCDLCGFVTRNKPSLVMHIKYGHVSERDRECKKCRKTFKRNVYLKLHYIRTHGIRYKTKLKKPKVEIKEEPEEFDDRQSVDLFEVEKHEILDDLNQQLQQPEPDTPTTAQKSTEEIAVEIIRDNREHLHRVPEMVFDDLYIENVVCTAGDDKPEENASCKGNKNYIDKASREQAEQSILMLLAGVRQKKEAKTLEKTRRQYNERMKVVVSGVSKKENVKLKYFNNNYSYQGLNKNGIEDKYDTSINVIAPLKNKSSNDKGFNDDEDAKLENNIGKTENDEVYNDDTLNNKSLNDKQSSVKKVVVDNTKNNNNSSQDKSFNNDNQTDTNDIESNIEKDTKIDNSEARNTNNKDAFEEQTNGKQCLGNEVENDTNKNEEIDNVSSDESVGRSQPNDENDSDWKEEKVTRKKQVTRTITKNKARNKTKSNTRNKIIRNRKQFDDQRVNGEKKVKNNEETRKSNKIIFNTHQCYTCFKLFETKEKLLDHCKDHFDVCNNISLKKCPLCDYVSKNALPRHMRLRHNIKMKVPYGNMKDKKDNTNGSRYYFEVDHAEFKKKSKSYQASRI